MAYLTQGVHRDNTAPLSAPHPPQEQLFGVMVEGETTNVSKTRGPNDLSTSVN